MIKSNSELNSELTIDFLSYESRLAFLESQMTNLQTTVVELKEDIKELRKDIGAKFYWMMGSMGAGFLSILTITLTLMRR